MNVDPLRGCFVVGTDTGVGKTRVSAALLHFLGRQGRTAAGFKPVAAGTELISGQRINGDVRALRDAGAPGISDAEVGPLQLDTPCAPHIAAAQEGRAIDCQTLMRAARSLQRRVEFLVVEGVGGFIVPMAPSWDSSHLACELGLPVVLIVGLRLGCLNHALLTAEAIRARSLRMVGWIGCAIDPAMLRREENIVTLREELVRRHNLICLGLVPWLEAPTPARVAAHLDTIALASAFHIPPIPPCNSGAFPT